MSTKTASPSDEKPSQSYPVPALEKGLDVLELLSSARRAMGLNAIAVELNRSRQELFRVVTCLTQRGYLMRDSAGNYRLSSKMLEVGSRHFAQQLLVTQAMPAMESLAEVTGESVQLSLVGRERMLVVANATGSSHLQLEVKVGSSIPQFNSVIGTVATAYAEGHDDAASWQRRCELQRRGDDVIEPAIDDPEQWHERMRTIRSEGCLVQLSPAHYGSRVYAGPLLDASGKLRAVLSITRLLPVRDDAARDQAIRQALVQTCREVSALLGATEETSDLV